MTLIFIFRNLIGINGEEPPVRYWIDYLLNKLLLSLFLFKEVVKLNRDWTGNKKTTFVQLGASNHSLTEREINDFYATDPDSLDIFLKALKRDNIKLHSNIWECSCGNGILSKLLINKGYNVYSSDLVNRGYGEYNKDFLKSEGLKEHDILTNPPYKYASDFVEHAINILDNGYYCIMYLKIQFLEGKNRRKLFNKYPPKYIYVNSSRQACYINGNMSKKLSSATCYCWFIWQKGYISDPIIKWI